MAIQFRPDVVSTIPQQNTLSQDAKSPTVDHYDSGESNSTLSIQYTRTEVYDIHGRLQLSNNGSGSLLDAYLEVRRVIEEQVAVFASGSEVSGSAEPDTTEAVYIGGIPEYWNKENTARRIFDIALMGYEEGMGRTEFADTAIEMVKQAYSDVSSMFGELPQLVQDTRQAVLDALEQFKSGAALSEISFE